MKNLEVYTKNQLALRNGHDREEVWVAYKGFIYDVTTSRLWRKGTHYEHWSGQDLTEEMGTAPHVAGVLDKFPIVGILEA